MKTEEIRELVHEIGTLQMQKRLLKEQIEMKKKTLKDACNEHASEYLETEKCGTCSGTGQNGTKTCHLCDGDGVRYYITVPREEDDDFVCRIFDVSQLVANQKKARELLKHQTFNAIFKPVSYVRININPTKKATASIGQ